MPSIPIQGHGTAGLATHWRRVAKRHTPFTVTTAFTRLLQTSGANSRSERPPYCKAFSFMHLTGKERAELLFHKRLETVLSEHQAKEQATRELTAKLRAERLARDAIGKPKPERKV